MARMLVGEQRYDKALWTRLARVSPSHAPALTEKRLVAAARQRDREAFDVLLQRHETLLRGYLQRRVGVEAVDDLLQDIWLVCWQALPQFDQRASFKTWLYRVASNRCVDLYRAKGRMPVQVSWEDAHCEKERQATNLDRDALESVQLRCVIQGILAELSESQQEVLDLYYYADLTLPEVALVLERNLNTIKYQFYRAHELVEQKIVAQKLEKDRSEDRWEEGK
jgi:RNA polymerase sigma-70 factor, ECF subfamily